jgi:hypothetical protein
MYPLTDFIIKELNSYTVITYLQRVKDYSEHISYIYSGYEYTRKREELSQRIINDARNFDQSIHDLKRELKHNDKLFPNKRIKLNPKPNLGKLGKSMLIEFLNLC